MKTKRLRGIIGSDTVLVSILFVLINLLFIYKYGLRQDLVSPGYLLILYPLILLSLFALLDRIWWSDRQLTILFFVFSALFFILSILIISRVDGAGLNVDRWSALDVSISALLDKLYPYSAQDHLGGYSSHLPTLLILGIPFHLIGDVGLLQPFVFLFFVYSLFITVENPKARLFGLLLLTLSVSYLWEVYVKSDLLSNFILIAGFVCLWYRKNRPGSLNRPLFLGFASGLLLFTRIIVFIPLSLALFKGFMQSPLKTKIKFLASVVVTGSLLLIIAFRSCPGKEVFMEYNPFKLQGSQLPVIIGVGLMLIPLFFSGRYRSLSGLLRLIIIFLAIPISLAFILTLWKHGLGSIINNSIFDLSYFNMLIPFIVIFLALKFEKRIARTVQDENPGQYQKL